MIVNNRCCRNLNCVKQSICKDNHAVYFQVKNLLNFSVFFILQYSLDGATVTLTSNVIPPGGKDKVNFSRLGRNICANVLGSDLERTFICNVCLTVPVRTCIEVFKDSMGEFMYREGQC